MLRLLGTCLIALGLAAIGFTRAAKDREQLRQLHELLNTLEELKRQIGFQQSDLRFICQHASLPLLKHCAEGLQVARPLPLREIWSNGVDTLYPLLSGEERTLAVQVGSVLGRYDAQRQCQALGQAQAQLQQLADERRTELQRSGRVYRTLGITAGALAFILLI